MVRILGIILGFVIMVLSVIGLLTTEEPVTETPGVLEETLPEIIPGAGSIGPSVPDPDFAMPVAGLGAAVNTYDDGDASITFGDGYYMLIPMGLVLTDEGKPEDHEIKGYSEDLETAFSIRCITPEQALTMEDLEDICLDLYGEADHVTGEGLTYLAAYDADTDTQICIFPSELSNQIYIIGMNGLSEEKPASYYFDSLTLSPIFS